MKITPEENGKIFNIQRYSSHDGPGIRTTVFLKGCPLKCFWCHNPESQSWEPVIFYLEEKCTLCGRCIEKCPEHALEITADGLQFDRSKCTGCGKCTSVCPNGARTLMGKNITADEIMKVVLRDKKYYDSTGGGVTISGGEPASQPGFALTLLKRCKEAGIHTILDTSGYCQWEVMDQLLDFADMAFYDIKCVDEARHISATGVSNKLILENAKKAAKRCALRVRVPLIPNFNDDNAEIIRIAEFVRDELKLTADDVNVLKYNKMCESKYVRMEQEFLGVTDGPDDDALERRKEDMQKLVAAQFG